MNSAIYSGWLRHRRFTPVENAFGYSVSMAFLDLDELDTVFRGRLFWSTKAFNIAWFRRDDYMIESSRPDQPLAETVRDLVRARIGSRPVGPIRLLTNVRRFGFGMNPVSFYYCYQPDGTSLHSIVAEITNTPWNEQYCYVLACEKVPHRFRFDKAFHVSPFMAMDFNYDWRFSTPGARLSVHMLNQNADSTVFDSTLVLKRREIGTGVLASELVRFPLMTLKVFAAIYFQAAKLWVKGIPVSTHPKSLTPENHAP
jgi:DUF1365 family protein